jgi:hypothetical protein
MPVPALDPCVGPIGFVCDLASNATGSAQAAASDYVIGGIAGAFVTAAAQLGELALTALDSSTAVDLSAQWLRANVAVLAAITLPLLVGLFVVQVATSVLRREAGGLVRAVVGVGKAVVGSVLALALTQLALTAVDEMCEAIARAAGTTVADAAAQFFNFTALATTTSPGLQLIIGLLMCVGFLLLWGVLLFRKAALILIAVFAPVAFAGSVWDQTRVWTRRWLEIVAALVFSKLVIVVVFVVGASAFSGTGPDVAGVGVGQAGEAARSLSDMLVGLLLLVIAVFAPWLTWRFVHWTGMEAASVMHQNLAANPVSRGARATGRQAQFAAQHAALSMVSGGAGAAATAAKAGKSAAAAKPAVPAAAPPRPAPSSSTRSVTS